ncbi:MAG: citrate lyase subunit alpha, partial [Gemmatimonadetes bacterium]|nr:citrate lyase subunit alpha [Gemmatimonadota bacterium]
MPATRDLVTNAAGREVPREVNGRERTPFRGVGKHLPDGRKHGPRIRSCADYPADGDKRAPDLRTALERANLHDGMVISTHHHFRNGDLVANAVMDLVAEMGIRDVTWAPSASFPCHAPMIRHLESGVLHHIEGSMNGPLGDFTSAGAMRGTGILRSHGGRWQAIQDGDLPVDLAVIAAPTADAFGNATGDRGASACGLLGFALADSVYAEHVIVVTDHLVPFPCLPWQIQGNNVDQVVVVDRVGDPSQIVSGTTRVTNSPDRLLIAEHVARFCEAAGIVKQSFSFQAGAGGITLAFALYLAERMRARGITASFVRGGSNRYLVDMLEDGLTPVILDGQTFDLEGVRSMRENRG